MQDCSIILDYTKYAFYNDVIMNILTLTIIIVALLPLYMSSDIYKNRKAKKRASKLIFDSFCSVSFSSSYPTPIEYRSYLQSLSEEDFLVYSFLRKCKWTAKTSFIKDAVGTQFAQFSFEMSNRFYEKRKSIYNRYPDKIGEKQRKKEYKKLSKDLDFELNISNVRL